MNFILKITFCITLLYISNFITKVSLGNIVVISYENTTNEEFNIDMFKEHITILKQDKYYILSTNNIINAMLSTKILPNYSVAITIASNKLQIINTVWPILAKQSLPFTLFIEPNLIGNKKNMSWNDINILHNNNHSSSLLPHHLPQPDGCTRPGHCQSHTLQELFPQQTSRR